MKLSLLGLLSGRSFTWLTCAIAVAAGTESVRAQVPAGFNDVVSMGGWNAPQGAVWDANDRMYVWEKAGKVWIVENGIRLAQPLIDLSHTTGTGEVGDWRDHGCLGFALDPNFLVNGYIYLMYMVDRHHLMNFGIPGGTYFTGVNEYYSATIMRITRYTATGPTFNTVNYGTRLVLVGETKKTGIPELHESHSTGTLLFGTDGTLLATVGDGASYNSADVGSAPETYYITALADSIIRPNENVGALRAQMVNCHNGKLLRIDPATGNGVPSNPYYDPAQPRAPKSRVWAMGLRNPFRAALRPGTGSTDPAVGDPGTVYIGDVGWDQWEELNVCYEGGMNFGWPLMEGLEPMPNYQATAGKNFDAPNPLFNGTSCTVDFFNFKDLLKQDTPIHLNGHPNPCDGSQQIPNTVPHFFHARPAIDWQHGVNRARTGIFSAGVAATIDLNAVGSPVPGPMFGGFAAIGGTWLSGTGWPAGYQNVYFHGDYPGAWIRRFNFNSQDAPVSVHDFGSNMGAVIWMGEGPEGCLYYVRYDSNELRRICYSQAVNLPPVAVASQNVQYGPGPLNVQFNGAGSYDPENSAITYLWNFGDGQTSTAQNPAHLFSPNPNVLTSYTVTLTVTDGNLQTNQTTLLVSVNNTPPSVNINSFADGSYYPHGIDTTFVLSAAVSDLEHGPGQLTYAWRTILHHNTHVHPEPANAAPVTSTLISGVGCDGQDYFYEIKLTVTDAGGLATSDVNYLYPRCYAIAPTALILSNVSFGLGPLNVQFDGSTSYDPGSIVSYAWDFGDGGTATGPTPAHNFTATGEHYVTLTVTDNDGLTGTVQRLITVLTLDPPQCVGALGSVRRDFWSGISGSAVINLTSSPNYPDNPTSTTFPTMFQGPANTANNYGTRMHGYIIAPETGIYHFTITSDDASVLYLSPNADPAFKQYTCEVPGSTGNTEYTKYPTQRSGNIQMQAGAYYYVEMIQKEGSGSDHMTLRWERPSNSTLTIVPGANLARWQDCVPSVNLRVNLQGAFDGQANLMRDALRSSSLVPAIEPFTALGYTQVGGGGGETVPGSLLAVTGANAVVDWVLVELRNKNNPSTIVATKSALLQRDGDVVGTNGYPRLLFNVATDNYYVAVRHRNHFGAMTFASTLLNKNQKLVDLTLTTTATYGTDARAVLSNGKRALWAGNVVPDASLKYAGGSNDRDPILVGIGGMVPTATVNGYLPADVTLDGVVKYAGSNNDRDPILINIGGTVPTATRAQQLP
ncbi:MAG: PKD domain-containing protein [Flavobacteriales bacterium]|nr:PKD domain-containing protein [Flavobacteriales bacterium]